MAEKPSVARDIARVLGATQSREGFLEGGGWRVTWGIGHLVGLAQPHEINPAWRQWKYDLLPMFPREWPLVVLAETQSQFEVVRKIINAPDVGRVVCATDAGREGELIFRQIYEASGCRKPVSRLWISSLTPEAIRRGFRELRPASDWDRLADAARGRSRADWLVGMNLSRGYALSLKEDLSVGRVQTPTLAMVVERELAIRSFVPQDFLQVVALFEAPPREGVGARDAETNSYEGTWFRPGGKEAAPPAAEEGGSREENRESLQQSMRLPADGIEAAEIRDRALAGSAAVDRLTRETRRLHPPLLYDLTELQRTANRIYGFSAQKTLDLAQALYERHKLISYPRTDSRHLSTDVARTLPRIVENIRRPYEAHLAPDTGSRPLGPRFVDDAGVTDHHAIIPTEAGRTGCRLTGEEEKIYDLVCRRLLAAWHADSVSSVTTVITVVTTAPSARSGEIRDYYHTSGTQVLQLGWKELELEFERKKARGKSSSEAEGSPMAREEEAPLPPWLEPGLPVRVREAEILKKTTRPPKRFTEATLLTAMETAGRTLEEKELSEAMKECGLGTPATRAAIIEILLKRAYIERQGKNLQATEKGIRLIQAVHPEVKSPAMTGQWEAYLKRIEKGKADLIPFLQGIERFVREVIGKIAGGAAEPEPARPAAGPAKKEAAETSPPASATPPEASLPLFRRLASAGPQGPNVAPGENPFHAALHRIFGFRSFRPNQEEICRAAVEGRDVLVVMPTGSGTSLCYQLPGLMRGGLTLVISPLIALMEDQAGQLQTRGLAVERIHSGRSRQDQRQASRMYLDGRLDFLFIAPERFRVPGFSEMLARRKPVLIAIDEAHCISQWGHDFRPDYRMLKQHLPLLRPAPVIALTATATPLVQDDIADQLGLHSPLRSIHGFRRDNIAIEAVEAPPSSRHSLARKWLSAAENRPAIVYVPTRKHAEKLASELESFFPAAPYHAGMDSESRDRVQSAFLRDEIQVIAATIAFGMGIDKPNVRSVIHTAMPGSVEGYYQEIGRAGRDGLPARAILMHSYADRYTHEFFFERDYPEAVAIARLYDQLPAQPEKREELRRGSRLDPETFDKMLEKLWIHGGALADAEDQVSRGSPSWSESYRQQREHKKAQMEQMQRLADGKQCRMASLVRYFGDREDLRESCGICDICAPRSGAARRFRPADEAERMEALHILAGLRLATGGIAVSRLFGSMAGRVSSDRKHFERLLDAMSQAGLVEFQQAVFQKEGRDIEYRKVRLCRGAWEKAASGQFDLQLAEEIHAEAKKSKARPRKASPPKPAARLQPKPVRRKKAEDVPPEEPLRKPPPPIIPALREALRFWRLAEAKRKRVPPFHIMSDRTLDALASFCPKTRAELVATPGIGPRTEEKYGSPLLQILRQF